MLQEVEDAELEENTGNKKAVKATGKVPLAKGRKKLVEEVLPSPKGQRVVPKIDPELRKKAEKAVIAKENKKKKKKELKLSPEVERDSFDEVEDSTNKSLSDKLGLSPASKKLAAKVKKAAGGKKDGLKQTKLTFGASKKVAEPDSGSEMDEFDLELENAAPLR